MFILVMVMITDKLPHSYAVLVNYNKFNSGHIQDNIIRNEDDNAFSNLSRNMTSTPNSIGPNLARGDRITNSHNNIGLDGTGDSGISSSILTEHGSYNSNLRSHSSSSSSSIFTQHAYQLTVNLPPPSFGTSIMSISITTANGFRDRANVAPPDVTSWTFNIPSNQGGWVQVCANWENLYGEKCNTYNTTGKDMSVYVSPSPLNNGNANYMYPGNNGIDGFIGHRGKHGIGIR